MTGNANVKQAVPFFRVSNIERSLRYYVYGLGFEMTRKWIVEGKVRWCWLQHGGAALMLQFPKGGHDSWSPKGNLGEGVTICFQCDDALAIYREVTTKRNQGLEALRRERNVGHVAVGSGRLQDRVREPHGCAGGHAVLRAALIFGAGHCFVISRWIRLGELSRCALLSLHDAALALLLLSLFLCHRWSCVAQGCLLSMAGR